MPVHAFTSIAHALLLRIAMTDRLDFGFPERYLSLLRTRRLWPFNYYKEVVSPTFNIGSPHSMLLLISAWSTVSEPPSFHYYARHVII